MTVTPLATICSSSAPEAGLLPSMVHTVLQLHPKGSVARLTPPSFLVLSRSAKVTAASQGWPRHAVVTLAVINVTRSDRGPFMCRVFNHFSNYNSDPGDTPHRLRAAALTCIISLSMLCMRNAARAF